MARILKTIRQGGSPADIALLKTEVGGVKTPADIAADLAAADLDGYLPELSLESLREYDDGTLGREYARFLDDNGLQPFKLSADLRERALKHTYMMRYIATHDLIHVVTGFDASYAGEMGVLAATVAQGFAPGGAMQEWSARVVYPVLTMNRSRIVQARKDGIRIGEAASNLLCFRYEDHLDVSLAAVRESLNIRL